MIIHRTRILFFLFLLLTSLYSADYNQTLTNADTKTYKELLKSLASNEVNDETVLQKALLEKLISLGSAKESPAVSILVPKNLNDYFDLFEKYLQDSVQKGILVRKIAQIENKLKTLKQEIATSDKNRAAFMTLQLQDAFYSKNAKVYNKQLDTLLKDMKQTSDFLISSLKNMDFTQKEMLKTIETYRNDSAKIKNEITKLTVEKERLELLGNVLRLNTTISLIDAKKDEYNQVILKIITLRFIQFAELIKKNNKEAFSLDKDVMEEISKFEYSDSLKISVTPMLHTMEVNQFGILNTVTGSTKQEIENIIASFYKIISQSIFSVNETPISILKIVISLFIFIGGFLVGGYYKVSIKRIAPHNKSFTSSTRTMLANLGNYLIIIIAFFISLNVMGINLSSIALVAGALSVGIGFGLQNVVSNFVSGLILMFERSVKVGDYVELSDSVRGHVMDIRMRSIVLTTNSNIDVIIPNQNFIQNNVVNWTMNDKVKRFDIPFGVAYGTKPEKVIEVVKNAVERTNFADIYTDSVRFTRVLMTEMGNSSVDFELCVWLQGDEIIHPKRTTSRFLVLIYNALYEGGIEIPFPQQDLHIRSIDENATLGVHLNQQAGVKIFEDKMES
jgi:potassium-dependent mechanosensitive channel